MITNAVQEFRADVRSHQYPSDEESYHLPKDTRLDWTRCWTRKRAMGALTSLAAEMRGGAREKFFGTPTVLSVRISQ